MFLVKAYIKLLLQQVSRYIPIHVDFTLLIIEALTSFLFEMHCTCLHN